MDIQIDKLLEFAISKEASDVHLVVDKPPIFRIHGNLYPSEMEPMSELKLQNMLFALMDEEQKATFTKVKELDFSYAGNDNYQFRFNLSHERGKIAATIRITSANIPSLRELGLPPIINELTKNRKGLILLSGSAGSGKSTTLNYVIDKLNHERKYKIITIEDPIEYHHKSKQSLIVQREVGKDTESFATALKFALRQDPDVVVVGEMRDLESISMALTTAETGHLVISTVHAPDAVETINRIIDVYPVGMRDQICVQLAENLIGIIGQMLVPGLEGGRRVLATEVLLLTTAIKNLIRRGALVELRGQIDAEGKDTYSYERCLFDLQKQGQVSEETVKEYSKHLEILASIQEEQFGQKKKVSIKVEKEDDSKKDTLVFKKKRIMIVDEDITIHEKLCNAIRLVGHEHFTFADRGKNLIDQVLMDRPEMIIISLGLGDADAFEICRQIKSLANRNITVVLNTGLLKPTDSQMAKDAGADDFVIKTQSYDLLQRAVKELSMGKESSEVKD